MKILVNPYLFVSILAPKVNLHNGWPINWFLQADFRHPFGGDGSVPVTIFFVFLNAKIRKLSGFKASEGLIGAGPKAYSNTPRLNAFVDQICKTVTGIAWHAKAIPL